MNHNQSYGDFRNLSKEMLAHYGRALREQAAQAKNKALQLYKQMSLEEQESSLMWLEKRIAIYPEQIGYLLELISDLYHFHAEERIFLTGSGLFLRTRLLLAARKEFQIS